MQSDEIDETVKSNPHVDPTAIDRANQAVKQLADAGIEIGGYHLDPPLGSIIPLRSNQTSRAVQA